MCNRAILSEKTIIFANLKNVLPKPRFIYSQIYNYLHTIEIQKIALSVLQLINNIDK